MPTETAQPKEKMYRVHINHKNYTPPILKGKGGSEIVYRRGGVAFGPNTVYEAKESELSRFKLLAIPPKKPGEKKLTEVPFDPNLIIEPITEK